MKVIYMERNENGDYVFDDERKRIVFTEPKRLERAWHRGHVLISEKTTQGTERLVGDWTEALDESTRLPIGQEVERVVRAMALRLLEHERADRLVLSAVGFHRVFRAEHFKPAPPSSALPQVIGLPCFEDIEQTVGVILANICRVEYLRIGNRTGSLIFTAPAQRATDLGPVLVGIEPGAVLMRIFHVDPESAYRLGFERAPESQ